MVHAVPATFAEIERVWSTYGLILSSRRSCIEAQNYKHWIFTRYNWDITRKFVSVVFKLAHPAHFVLTSEQCSTRVPRLIFKHLYIFVSCFRSCPFKYRRWCSNGIKICTTYFLNGDQSHDVNQYTCSVHSLESAV